MAIVYSGGTLLVAARKENIVQEMDGCGRLVQSQLQRRGGTGFRDRSNRGLREFHALSAWYWHTGDNAASSSMSSSAQLLDSSSAQSSIVGITDAVKLQERLGQLDFTAQHNGSFCDSLCTAVAQHSKTTATAVREQLGAYLVEQEPLFFQQRNHIKSTYSSNVRNGKVWCDDTMLHAIAEVFRVQVRVITEWKEMEGAGGTGRK